MVLLKGTRHKYEQRGVNLCASSANQTKCLNKNHFRPKAYAEIDTNKIILFFPTNEVTSYIIDYTGTEFFPIAETKKKP